MSSSFLPFFEIETTSETSSKPFVDGAVDENGHLIMRGGKPMICAENEAKRIWATRALQINRGIFEMFSFGFGCEVERLVGMNFSMDTTKSEIKRAVTDCLLSFGIIAEVFISDLVINGDLVTVTADIDGISTNFNLGGV